jgi:murein DD-endopeptidase MepM/ murein hydrolase activator NlpD
MVGSACRLVLRLTPAAALCLALCWLWSINNPGFAQALYKYRGDNGEWIYSDRPPADNRSVEVRRLAQAIPDAIVDVAHTFVGTTVELVARNDYFAPVELYLEIATLRGLSYPDPDQQMVWVLPPRSKTTLMQLGLLENGQAPFLEYGYRYMPGDPRSRHIAPRPYRAPFAVAKDYPITQAYPEVLTHTGPDSYHAVDIAMPIGTDIVAARAGIVFDVASTNFQVGLDMQRDGPAANVVRILHDDGTYAVYAHLNTNTIRVRPGDRVERGDYIADSGNTGYSSGPHLHFAVVRNVGMRIESVPITFLGANLQGVPPVSGALLTAY